MNIKQLAASYGLTLPQLSELINVPLRTVEHWAKHGCKQYIYNLIELSLICNYKEHSARDEDPKDAKMTKEMKKKKEFNSIAINVAIKNDTEIIEEETNE